MDERPADDPGQLPPLTVPDLSPEARRKNALRARAGLQQAYHEHLGAEGRFWQSRAFRVINRVWTGVYHDGFIHAGNLAYMSILALFPFFLTASAVFSLFGEHDQRATAIHNFLLGLPPMVAAVLEPVAHDVILARSGWMVWAGGLVGLWTVGSLIETLRDILRRSYGTRATLAFWRYRLMSSGIIVVAVVALMFGLIGQIAVGAVQQAADAWFPRLDLGIVLPLGTRLVTALVTYLSLWLLFLTLTPKAYRGSAYPKWPGALLVTLWWLGTSIMLPVLIRHFFTYNLTYGSLAGIMIALFFFWLVGLGVVMGAELNAALAESPEERDAIGQDDNRAGTGAPNAGSKA